MKLASLRSGGRDGTLIVDDRSLERASAAPEHATALQAALDDWEPVAPGLILDPRGRSIFAAIDQEVAAPPAV